MTETQVVTPEILALAEKIKAKKDAQLEKIKTNLDKYPHAFSDTLTFDEAAGKYKVKISCQICCDDSRWVFTSDLFQIDTCVKCSEQRKAEKKADKKAKLAAALALLKKE